MKIKKLSLENCLSFLEKQDFCFEENMAILVGPNGGCKTNLMDILLFVLRKFIVKAWNSESVRASNGSMRDDWTCYEFSGFNNIEKHTNGINRDQIIDVYIAVTKSDIQNIKKIISEYESMKSYSVKSNGFVLLEKTDFLRVVDCENKLFKYTIKNNQIYCDEIDLGVCFLRYLLNS